MNSFLSQIQIITTFLIVVLIVFILIIFAIAVIWEIYDIIRKNK